jgi:tetratricopeptide (TPR) repeat protein
MQSGQAMRWSDTGRTLVAWLVMLVMLGLPAAWAGEAAPAASPKVRLAVLPFQGPSAGLPEDFGLALAQAVGHGLHQIQAVRLADAGDIAASSQRLHLAVADVLSDDALLGLGRDLRVRGLVTGSYVVEGDTLKVQARVADLEGGDQVIATEEVTGPTAKFLTLQGQVVQQLLAVFRLQPTRYDEGRLRGAFSGQTASLPAYVLYARGAWAQGLGTREGHERAIALLAQALEADANFPLAHFALGVSLQATNSRWKAAGEFRKAIQLDPGYPEAHKRLGDLLVTSPRRMYDQAIQAYARALELAPDYAEAMVGLGDARQAKGQYDEAIQEYRLALQLEPDNARVHYGLGKIYYNEKQLYHEAVAEYRQAITLDPKFLEARLGLGDIYQEKGLYQDAIAQYQQILAQDPRQPGAAYALALAYEKVDPRKAIDRWEQYIDLAATLPTEKDWVDIARKHLEKLRREAGSN